MAESGSLPFQFLAARSVIRTAIRMLEKNSNNRELPVVQRATEYAQQLTGRVLPNVAQIIRQSDRLWYLSKPSINWDVRKKVSAGDPSNIVRPIVAELLSHRYHNYTALYTDGSRKNDKVGSGVYGNGIAKAISLPEYCNVFSAEAYAIKTAINIPNLTNQIVIFTDSESCLRALESGHSKHPWIQQIETIALSKNIQFCWIPAHTGVPGNEIADQLANEATNYCPENIPTPARDVVKTFGQLIRQDWERKWHSSREIKLREIKADTRRWIDRNNPADQRMLTRLRIGHTRLTHTFLLKKEQPPVCETCGETVDVRHILLTCRRYETARQQNRIEATSLQAALRNEEDAEKRILSYLNDTGLYRQI